MSQILEADNLTKVFQTKDGDVRAVDGVSFSLEPGDFVAIHGPSGCGKSTLLLMSGALLSPDDGTVTINETDPYSLSAEARSAFRGENIGFVFQQFHLIPYLSVLDNILVNELAANGSSDDDWPLQAEILLEKFQLGHRKNHVPSRLSVGEQQRVALARALLRTPALILADEPTGNLDPENSQILLDHLGEFAAGGGAVLMVTHDDRAREAASRSIDLS
ncbi:MAG: ABC transporter ATP-binding protein [Verrucomicrobiales bacterium]|nr:ABC transporter ATP-binding protein [Verrucomicrobiales bacterium]